MRVFMTADAVGGVWTYALELARNLNRFDVEVHLAVLGPPPDRAQLRAAEAAGVASIDQHNGSLEWMEEPWDEVAAAGRWLLERCARVAPDVVHLNSFAHGSLQWPVPVVVVGHSCVLSWWETVKGEAAPQVWERYRGEVTSGLHGAQAVVAPSQWMLAQLQRLYGLRGGSVIHNGLDPEPGEARARQNVVVSSGRLWDQAKNVAAVLEVAPALSWPVVIAGGHVAPQVGNVEAVGVLSRGELLARLATAGLFVLPARYEPFGLGPLEAAQAGCPLVLGDIPSLRELWEGAAHFVDPDDHEQLRDVCSRLIDSDEDRARWGERASQRAAGYSGTRMATAYASLYGELTGGPAERASLAAGVA